MKLNKLTTAFALLATAAAMATSARAQIVTTYNSGDAFIGFEQAGNTNDYLVDIGSITQFIGKTAPVTLQLSTADLVADFGSSWASNSQTNLVQWGVVANDQSKAISGDTTTNTIWFTKGEATPGTTNTPPTRLNSNGLGVVSNKIQGLETAVSGGFSGTTSTANAATPGNEGITETSTAPNAWSTFAPGSTGFGLGYSIEQPLTGSFSGPTDSVLDLFQDLPGTAAGQPSTLLGTLSLGSTGLLTFDPAGAAAVPEPSAYALGITAIALFVILKRRKSIADA